MVFYLLGYAGITAICLVPFGISVFYFSASVRLLMIAKKEENEAKIKSAKKVAAISFVGIVFSILIWRWLLSQSKLKVFNRLK